MPVILSPMPKAASLDGNANTFGSCLRTLRKRARLTQRDLGTATGYSEGQICRFEQGHKPPDLATLKALFVPALGLMPSPNDVARLMELAAEARGDDLTNVRVTGGYQSPARPASRNADADADSLSQVFDWYLANNPEAAMRLARSLTPMWYERGDHNLARRRLAEVLQRGGTDLTAERAELLLSSATFANEQSQPIEGRQHAEQALAIAQSIKRDDLVSQAMYQLAWSAYRRNDHPAALALFAEALATNLKIGFVIGIADCLSALAHVTIWHGDRAALPQVKLWINEAEVIFRHLKLPDLLLWVLTVDAERAHAEGDTREALTIIERALRIAPSAKNERQLAWCHAQHGEWLSDIGRYREALAALQTAEREFKRVGEAFGSMAVGLHRAVVYRRQANWSAARAGLEHTQQVCEAQGHTLFELRSNLHLALLARTTGDDVLLLRAYARARVCVALLQSISLSAEERAEFDRMPEQYGRD